MAQYKDYLREAEKELEQEDKAQALEKIKLRLREIRQMKKVLAKAEKDLQDLLEKEV